MLFGKDGKQNAEQTKNLQQYSVQGTDAAALKALLGEPSSAEYMASCMTWEGQTGDDGILTYKNFTVFTFRYGDKEIVCLADTWGIAEVRHGIQFTGILCIFCPWYSLGICFCRIRAKECDTALSQLGILCVWRNRFMCL